MDVDIDTLRDSAQRSLSAADDSRFLPDDPSVQDPSLRADTSMKRKRSTVAIKKPKVLSSDDETSNIERDSVEGAFSDLGSPLSEMSDDGVELDALPKRGAPKPKASVAKAKAGKVNSGQLKGAKAKGPKEKEREILMKDERRLAVPPTTTSRASSAAAQSQPSDLFSNEDVALPSVVDPLADGSKDTLGQTIPKKRKLPTIKKTKTTASATGTPTPATTQKPVPPAAQEAPKPPLPASEQRKQALTGVRDVDLGNSKVYAELFKSVGGDS